MRYTTTDGPDEPLNAIKDGSLGDKMGIAEMEARKEKEVVYGPQPPPKFLTTRGLIIRGIIFFAAIAGALYLIWQEFSGR